MVDPIPQQQERRIIFGNKSIAVLADCKVYEKEDIIIFSFKPTYSMKVRDKIKNTDFDEESGLIVKAYPRKYCECSDPSPEIQTWFLYCDYYGVECDVTKKINQELLLRNQFLQKENEALRKQATIGLLDITHMISFPEETRTRILEQMAKQNKALTYNPLASTSKEEKK